jgi:UDP-N-acetyl-D-glucosamine dehydrogenase
VPFDTALASRCDCAVIATDHGAFDYERIARLPLVVDTRNALKGSAGSSIFRL